MCPLDAQCDVMCKGSMGCPLLGFKEVQFTVDRQTL